MSVSKPGRLAVRLLAALCLLAAATPAPGISRGAGGESSAAGRFICVNPDDCPPPYVDIYPGTGGIGSSSTSVDIWWEDDVSGLKTSTKTITVTPSTAVASAFNFAVLEQVGTKITVAQSAGILNLPSNGSPVTVTAHICNNGSPSLCTDQTATYYYAPPPQVTALESQVLRNRNEPVVERFRVVNPGDSAATYTLSANCDMPATACQPAVSKLALAGHDTAVVGVNYKLGAGGTISSVNFGAVDAQGGYQYANTTVIITSLDRHPGMVGVHDMTFSARNECVTISVGPGAAYECGDLRLVHGLPVTRVLNKPRTPTLIYNSQTAYPNPVIADFVVRDFSMPRPDSLNVRLMINGVLVGSQKYRGYIPDSARVAVAWDAAVGGATARPTGLYDFTITTDAYYPGGGMDNLTVRGGRIALVNRMASPFGRGWWLAGLEQLIAVSSTEKLWVGGDGSTRLYTQSASDVTKWVGPVYDRPDTLFNDAATGGWKRPLPGGDTIFYDAMGNHARSKNTLGHTTSFTWTSGKLTQVTLPAGSLAYTFSYSGSTLSEVIAPPVGGVADSARVVRFEMSGGDLVRVWDPQYRVNVPVGSAFDYTKPYVQFTTTAGRVTARANRLGVPMFFRYGTAGLLSGTALGVAPGDSIKVAFRPAEGQGLGVATAVTDTALYTILDGPRTDADDRTRFYLNRWGAPWKVVNPLGAATTLLRGASLPSLVTRVTYPNGREVSAAYDARANLVSTTDWSVTAADGRYATTSYGYDLRWDRVTQVIQPEGEVTRTAYDAKGRVQWTQVGPSASRRLQLAYNSGNGMLETVTFPATATLAATSESHGYDALGNLSLTTSAVGRTELTSDAIGRTRLTRRKIDAAATLFQNDTTYYDILDRVVRQTSDGPAMSSRPAQKLVVTNRYDLESRPLSATRRSAGNEAGLDSVTTTWTYDAAGRKVAEIAPDATPANLADNPRDTLSYDAAGNLTRTLTRRGDTIRTRYDVLNRPLVQYHSAATYAVEARGIPSVTSHSCDGAGSFSIYHTYPQYPNYNTCGYRVPADSSLFTYDAVSGFMTHADNGDAKVTRTYQLNGQLASETQQIRASNSATDFTTHTYTIGYAYDLNGRRTRINHPSQLGATTTDATGYGYDAETGAPRTVTDPLGYVFTYGYDTRGQITSLSLPGSVVNGYTYDQEGRLTQYNLDVPSVGGRVSQTHYTWDARGKLLGSGNDVGAKDQFIATYSGLGHVVTGAHSSTGTNQFGNTVVESTSASYTYDALGNVYQTVGSTSTTASSGGWLGGSAQNSGTTTGGSTYQAYTGRMLTMSQGAFSESYSYDAAGNTLFQYGITVPSLTRSDLAQYYGSDGKLRVLDRRNLSSVIDYTTVWEEYRYDALGRRVWVRTTHNCSDSGNAVCVQNTVRRTVWDGDQVLYEIRMMQSESENDGTPATTGNLPSGYPAPPLLGRVANVHGLNVDQPLSVIRLGYVSRQPFAVFPLWDVEGRAPYLLFGNGSRQACDAGVCLTTYWALGQQVYGAKVNGFVLQPNLDYVWIGALAADQKDNSGLLYRRNRYYNPQNGRFTQEDPLGLAGGVNAYGFAGGDPVSYGDPYGLKPDSIKLEGRIIQMNVQYLKNHSPTFRRLYEALDADPRVHILIRGARSREEDQLGITSFSPPREEGGWSLIFLSVSDTEQGNLDNARAGRHWRYNFVSGIGHEVGHAAAYYGKWDSACRHDPSAGGTGCIVDFDNLIRSQLPADMRNWLGVRQSY